MKKYSMETVVGIFVLAGLICVGYMTVKLGKMTFFGDKTYAVYARFTSVVGLRPGSSVEIYGIEVGRVKSLNIDAERQMANVEMQINEGVKIYDDASATIKSTGVIGDKYVKVDPGGSGAVMRAGGVITDTSVPPDIEDVIGKYAFGDVRKEPAKTPEKAVK